MVRNIQSVGLAIVLIMGLSACGGGSTIVGPWWVEMKFDCGGSNIHATIPFEVAEDKTLSGSGQVSGLYELRPPLICSEFRDVRVGGAVDIAGAYTSSGGGGFVFDKIDFQVGSEYDPETVCQGKPLNVTAKGIVSMDLGMFISSLMVGWANRVNLTNIEKNSRGDAPDISARDGAESLLQAVFCKVNLVLHQGIMSAALPPTPAQVVSVSSPTPILNISYTELAKQLGYRRIQVDKPASGAFSLWVPGPYEDTQGRWVTGEFLEIVSRAIDDYAYDIFADNAPLFTASDTTFYHYSPHANQCAELKNKVTVGQIEFAVRTGQDRQLADMPLSNYAGLLTLAIQEMRGDEWHYPQESKPFLGAGYETWRIISDYAPRDIYFQLSNFQGRGYDIVLIDYILKEGDRIWVLSFSAAPEFYFEESACAYLAEDFDLIVRTFKALPNENK